MGKVEPRSVTPIRSHFSALRFGDFYAPRTQPPPNLPGGSADKLADNYYYARDGRREAPSPNVIAIGGNQKLLNTKSGKEGSQTTDPKLRTPGSVYRWD